MVRLDDDALPGGNPGGPGDDPDAVNVTGTLGHSYGADGAGSTLLLGSGAPAGFTYATEQWRQDADHHPDQHGPGGAAGAALRRYLGSLHRHPAQPIEHPAGLAENNAQFDIGYEVRDHDGDCATGSLCVNVDDDTPTASCTIATALDDEAQVNGIDGGPGDLAGAESRHRLRGRSTSRPAPTA